jgi:hypothetical protein
MHGDAVESAERVDRMSFGPTLLGGLVGAAVGVGAHVVLETGLLGTTPYEAPWFAIVIGLLTGLGVRWANKHHMERSYARGAVSAVIALAAIVLSTLLISKVMANRDAMAGKKPIGAATVAAKADADNLGEDAADGDAVAAEPGPMADAQAGLPTGQIGNPRGPNDLNPWLFVFVAAGALVAYEFGRGIDHSKRTASTAAEPGDRTEPEPPLAGATDPSN